MLHIVIPVLHFNKVFSVLIFQCLKSWQNTQWPQFPFITPKQQSIVTITYKFKSDTEKPVCIFMRHKMIYGHHSMHAKFNYLLGACRTWDIAYFYFFYCTFKFWWLSTKQMPESNSTLLNLLINFCTSA